MSTRIKTDELDQWHEYNIYTPARLISLDGEINSDKATEFIKNIRLLDHVSDKEIKVLINSEGGDVRAGMDIVDAIKECQSKVITHVVGVAESMAAIILQAGDERWISSSGSIMIHVGEEGYEPNHPKNLEAWIKESKRLGEMADNLLFKQIKKKKPRYQRKTFNELITFDKIYTAEKAIEMGLVDKIMEHKEL